MQDKLRAMSFIGALAIVPLGASGAWLVTPGTVAAQDTVTPGPAATAQARARFADGVRAYDRGDWARALDFFRAAYTARPHPSVLVNIANCYVQLGRPTQAVAHFTRYLSEIGDAVDAAQRAEVEQALAEARAMAASLTITASPEGTMVFVDGDQVGRAPLTQPVAVDPGPHVVEMRSEGGASTTVRVTVTRGEHANVRISGTETPLTVAPAPLPESTASATASARTPAPSPWRPPGSEAAAATQPTPPPAIVPPTSPSAEAETSAIEPVRADADDPSLLDRIPLASWIIGSVGVAALAVGTGFGFAALSSESDFDAAAARIEAGDYAGADELATLQARGRDASDAQSRNAVLSDVALGLGVVGVATAVTLFVIDRGPDHGESATTRSRPRARTRVGAAPLPGGGMVGLSGSL